MGKHPPIFYQTSIAFKPYRTDGTTDLKANRRQSKSDRPEWHIAVVLVIGTSLIGIGSIPIGGMVEVEVVGRVRENDSRGQLLVVKVIISLWSKQVGVKR
ncbi:hypothetical protein GW17_00039828 [Ensete ventricosum]|nr:hypothetical protein GW17_00039828 [Ensete ventricosum]RZR82587.1 hypothetical protein BHM03_00009038 [Ensete ventricosum]